MKSKKGLIGLIVVVAVLVLGIGYAVVSSVNLSITGTAATETKDLDVVISAANPADSTKDTYGTVSDPADKTATITVKNMTGLSDVRTVTYTVSNKESDLDAKVYVEDASKIQVTKSEFFTVETSITGSANAITVPAGGTNTFTVTTKLAKLPIQEADSTTNITITIKADPVAKSGS